jgi:hypothetical protein
MTEKRKFLSDKGMQDSILQERRYNAHRRREGLLKHPTRTIVCGCSSQNCGAFYCTVEHIIIPTPEECKKHLTDDNKKRKPPKKACDPKYQVMSCVHVGRR